MASGTRKTKIVLSAADREHAIKLIEEGNRRSIVSMIYGVADSTISKWMKTRQASGITESAPKVERRNSTEALAEMTPKHLCRTCLADAGELFEVFGDTGIELALSQKLNDYLKITIEETDEFALMCDKCIVTLNEFHDMFSLAQEVQPHFTNMSKGNLKKEHVEQLVENESFVEMHDTEFLEDVEEDVSQLEEVIIEETIDEEEQPMTVFENAPHVTYETLDGDNVTIVDENEVEDTEEEEEEEQSDEEIIQEINTMVTALRAPRAKQVRETISTEQREEENELIRQTVTLLCTDCNFVAPTLEALLFHYRESHKKRGVFTCCDREFTKRVKLVEHVKLHNDPKAFSCGVCDKQFTSKYTLGTHMATHLPEELCEFTCEVCGKKIPTKSRLTLHMKTHSEESYQCHICQKTFTLKGTLVAHIKCVHERASDAFICDVCAKPFKTKEAFLTHQVNHMENPPPRISCPLCPKKLKHRESLNQHLLRHKRANERHYCDVCSKEFNCIKRMRAHKKYVHSTEKYQCEHCEKTFKRPIYLKEHMASHTGESLYTCSFCPRQFNSNANKYSHQKAQHPTEWQLARQKKLEE